jgi:sec-independent protein translocase protein TatB
LFDVSFSELVVIAVIALIVIGPEKLPKVARTVGLLVGRMQRYVNNVKADISREMQFEDLQKLQQDIRHGANRIRGELDQVQSNVAEEARNMEHSIGNALDEVKKPTALPDERL